MIQKIAFFMIFTIFLRFGDAQSATCPPYDPNRVVLIPHEYLCTFYYRCEQNGPVLMECWPPGTHFSPNTLRCEWASVANCTLSGVPPTTTLQPTTSSSTTTRLVVTTTTSRLPDTTSTTTRVPLTTQTSPQTVPVTTTSTVQVTYPVTTTTLLTTTTRPVVTTPDFIIPTVPTRTNPPPTTTVRTTPSTSTSTVTTTQSTSTSTVTTTQKPNPCPEIDDPNNLVFLPDPENCAAYFLCFNGDKIPRECADGLFWDVEMRWCNYINQTSCDGNVIGMVSGGGILDLSGVIRDYDDEL